MKNFTDNTISLVFEGDTYETIHRLTLEEYPNKTGGILIGRYTANNSCACVTEILPPTPDSKTGTEEFFRGTQGLKEAFKKRWDTPERTYYLGEWHSRPLPFVPQLKIDVEPSALDIQSMIELAEEEVTKCPQPMLVIIGIRATEDKASMVYTNIGVYGFDRGSPDFVTLTGVKVS